MKKNLIFGLTLLFTSILILSFTDSDGGDVGVSDDYMETSLAAKDWNACVSKVDSERGGTCLNYGFSEMKYTVHLVNSCSEQVDLMSCVQRENGRWQCFYRLDMKQNDTLHAYACRGNGKFLKWVREAGDITTKFATLAEVNKQY